MNTDDTIRPVFDQVTSILRENIKENDLYKTVSDIVNNHEYFANKLIEAYYIESFMEIDEDFKIENIDKIVSSCKDCFTKYNEELKKTSNDDIDITYEDLKEINGDDMPYEAYLIYKFILRYINIYGLPNILKYKYTDIKEYKTQTILLIERYFLYTIKQSCQKSKFAPEEEFLDLYAIVILRDYLKVLIIDLIIDEEDDLYESY